MNHYRGFVRQWYFYCGTDVEHESEIEIYFIIIIWFLLNVYLIFTCCNDV
jgi:hypothetical protein